MFNMNLGRMNKIATLAILPGMVLAIMLFSSAAQSGRNDDAPLPTTGTLVIANLCAETMTFHDFARSRTTTLSLPGAPHEMVELNGRLYVTLGRADLVVEVDPNVPAVVRTMRLAGEPHGIVLHGEQLAITLDRRDAIALVDPVILAVTARIPTGDTPHVIASGGSALFVTDTRDNRIRRIENGASTTAETGALPEGLALVSGLAVTADYEGRTLSTFDADTLELRSTIDLDGPPVRILDLGGNRIGISVQEPATLVVADLASGAITDGIEAPGRPDGLCLSPDGRHLAVAGNAGRTTAVFEVETWAHAVNVGAGDGPGACLWIGGR